MKRRTKIILLTLLIGLLTIGGFIGFGFYTMEIEDHYGDMQNLYYESKNGDLIINKSTLKFGIVEKDWKRIYIKENGKSETDLYNWIYDKNGAETRIEIYRQKNSTIEFEKINYSDITKMIENSEMKLVIQN
ncbi:hypothetical protein [Arcticibacterium luteifluviistationis]|uniref:Uncharacterized protein n=1 Tax=Arcticibacterium luteifluviistationis TaxID=1784714 RepID=A0A2Z4GCL8_9BACT|nr:hypothetical protein [Arcticibacterium luteifluviistationis]AWV98840.1 hypothetical protein DJ013_11930 [Arcticibacterium luteifluviistationis]